MKSVLLAIALALPAFAQATDISAADIGNGKDIHNENCMACHARMTGGDGAPMYTRADRKVDSLVRLESFVRMCDSRLNLQMFDDDMIDIVAFLNKEYYKFQ